MRLSRIDAVHLRNQQQQTPRGLSSVRGGYACKEKARSARPSEVKRTTTARLCRGETNNLLCLERASHEADARQRACRKSNPTRNTTTPQATLTVTHIVCFEQDSHRLPVAVRRLGLLLRKGEASHEQQAVVQSEDLRR